MFAFLESYAVICGLYVKIRKKISMCTGEYNKLRVVSVTIDNASTTGETENHSPIIVPFLDVQVSMVLPRALEPHIQAPTSPEMLSKSHMDISSLCKQNIGLVSQGSCQAEACSAVAVSVSDECTEATCVLRWGVFAFAFFRSPRRLDQPWWAL